MMLGVATLLRRLTPSRLRPRIRGLLFEWLGLDWDLRTGIRIHLSNYGDWVIYNEIFVSGEYDQALVMAFDRAAAAGRTPYVLDLGANSGFFTLRVLHESRARRMAVSVTAVEALETMAGRFRARMSAQPIADGDVRLVQGLAGVRAGTGVLYEDTAHMSSSTCTPPLDATASRRAATRIPYVDLSDVLKTAPRVDLLKCDIEGSEERVIETYPDVFAKTDVAVFEFHPRLCDVPRCQALLREYGFTHHATLRDHDVAFTYAVWR